MDARWTEANDKIHNQFNRGGVAFRKLDLDTIELHIDADGMQKAMKASGDTSAIPYGYVVPKTVTDNGVTYPAKSVWVDPRHDLNGGVYVHELLHIYSWPLPTQNRNAISEGLTDYFTRKIDWTFRNRAYDKLVQYVDDFVKKNDTEAELEKWYFCHRPEFIMKKLGQTFVKWRYMQP